MSRYAGAIEADLLPGIDPFELWQQRRWRRLLNLIDHLPQNSHFTAAVEGDEEHMRLLEEARAKQPKSQEKWAPPRAYWTTDTEILATIRDSVEKLGAITIGVNLPKGKKPPKVDAYPRPVAGYKKRSGQAMKDRRAAHEALADRVLARRKRQPGKAASKD